MSVLSSVMGVVTMELRTVGMCMQPTLKDTLALFVMMAGDLMKLMLCAGT